MIHLNGGVLPRLCDALPDLVFLLDGRFVIGLANRRAARLLGRSAAEMVGRPLLELVAGDPAPIETYLQRCARSGEPLPGSVPLATPSGPMTLHARGAAIKGDGGVNLVLLRCLEKPQVSRLFQNLNARLAHLADELHRGRRLQIELRDALEERELLLKEVHHRVRNNLQVVSSFLSLQAREAGNEVVREVLREAQTRIRALGLVHGQLYKEHRLGEVDLGELVPELCVQLASVYGVPKERIGFAIALSPWSLELNRAVPAALLITEAVTNALKHAYPEGRSGTIRVHLEQHRDTRILCIGDDGVGLPETRTRGRKGSLGMRLMQALAEQLDSRLEVRSTDGVEVRLALPVVSPGG